VLVRRCAYLAGPRNSWSNRERRRGVRAAVRAHGIEVVELGPFAPRFEAGVQGADIALAADVTAVLAPGDTLGGPSIPVQPLRCVHGARLPAARGSLDGIPLVTRRHLAAVIRQGPPLPPNKVRRVTAPALELLRPAA
jgi:hypothetical protein